MHFTNLDPLYHDSPQASNQKQMSQGRQEIALRHYSREWKPAAPFPTVYFQEQFESLFKIPLNLVEVVKFTCLGDRGHVIS